MNRKEKQKLLKGLIEGSVKIKDIKSPVGFMELSTIKGRQDFYFDKLGNVYSNEQRQKLIEDTRNKCVLLWEEVKTY